MAHIGPDHASLLKHAIRGMKGSAKKLTLLGVFVIQKILKKLSELILYIKLTGIDQLLIFQIIQQLVDKGFKLLLTYN